MTRDAVAIESTVQLAAARDPVTFARIVAAHHPDMTRVAYVVTGGDQAADDEAVRSAWSIAWAELRSRPDAEPAGPWLLALAANESRRRLGREGRPTVVEIHVAASGRVAGDPTLLIDALDLEPSIRRLGPDDRVLLALRYAAGLDPDEIGSEVGASAPAVDRRLARLVDRMRKRSPAPELDAFEIHLERAVRAYVDRAATLVDPTEVARSAAASEGAIRWRARRGPSPARPRILLAALVVAVVALVVVLGWRPPRDPQPLVPTGFVIAASTGWQSPRVVADPAGVAWVSGPGLLARLDVGAGTSRTWTIADDAAFRSSSVAAARGGGVWLIDAPGRSVRWFDGSTFRDVIETPNDATVNGLAEGPDGTLWASSDLGVYRWGGRAWAFVGGERPTLEAALISVDAAGGVWVFDVTQPGPVGHGVSRFDGSRWTTYTGRDSAPLSARVKAIESGPDGTVWIATETGVARFDDGSWTGFGCTGTALGEPGLGIGIPVSLAVEPSGAVWAVEDSGARIARFDGSTWVVSRLPVLPTETPVSVASTSDGIVVANDAGLYRFAGGTWQRVFESPSSPIMPDPWFLAAVSANELWAYVPEPLDEDWIARGVLWHWRDGTWTAGPALDAMPPNPAFRVGPDERLWAATSAGVAVLEGDHWTTVLYRGAHGLAFSPDGTVYLGGSSDLGDVWTLRHDADGWTTGTLPDSPFGAVDSIAVGGDGTVWAATSSEEYPGPAYCLARFAGGHWEMVGPQGVVRNGWFGPVSSCSADVLVAPNGDVWASIDTGAGAPERHAVRFDGRVWTVYGEDDGLPALSGTMDPSGYGAGSGEDLAVAPDGTVWASTSSGLAHFDGARWRISDPGQHFGPVSVAPDGAVWIVGPIGIERMPLPVASGP